ncbi:GLPGLI family protein [Flavobacterium subsaxonicum]|uniref:GLPGLI family protein n=1 Tax=Flavobacterium subsaxonicum TaxID=426226 RepID=UPI000403CD7E|nr:GLPGLI family protein [Flavobacterium subsaxonicum]
MLKNISLLLLLSCSFAFSQIKNGVVQYGIKTLYDPDEETLDVVKSELDKTTKATVLYTFNLKFTPKESYFYVNPSMPVDGQTIEDFCSLVMVESKFYVAPTKNQYRHDGLLCGNEYLINYEQKSDWELTNETKIINGYTCYKATSIKHNSNGWDDNPKFTITAWYTPKIPVAYGPNGYHGLPGLILELQTYTTTLYVKKIDLNLDKDPAIDRLEKGKVLTQEEVREIIFNKTPQEFRGMVENDIKARKIKSDEIEKRIAAKKAAKTTTN